MRTGPMKYERIRNMRIDSNLTQREVADYLHVKQNTYSQYELGILNFPLDIVVRLAPYYDTSIDYLVGLTDERVCYPRARTRNTLF